MMRGHILSRSHCKELTKKQGNTIRTSKYEVIMLDLVEKKYISAIFKVLEAIFCFGHNSGRNKNGRYKKETYINKKLFLN